jgi:hypothetical protein
MRVTRSALKRSTPAAVSRRTKGKSFVVKARAEHLDPPSSTTTRSPSAQTTPPSCTASSDDLPRSASQRMLKETDLEARTALWSQWIFFNKEFDRIAIEEFLEERGDTGSTARASEMYRPQVATVLMEMVKMHSPLRALGAELNFQVTAFDLVLGLCVERKKQLSRSNFPKVQQQLVDASNAFVANSAFALTAKELDVAEDMLNIVIHFFDILHTRRDASLPCIEVFVSV